MEGRIDVNERTGKQIIWKQQNHVTWWLERPGSRYVWWRNMCATIGLFETTCEGLLNLKFNQINYTNFFQNSNV